ncbi:MAG TPA: sigma-70 family RNA polymerase sigma factor [Gemmatimonadaceae bacterium]|nr:sigma-70 family RNA polymerase sigma factor [Gemmatimonadaceae bacterium]
MERAPDLVPDGESVTALLTAWRGGDDSARDRLLIVVYGELHRLAERALRGDRPGHTLQATALIHEAYLRLVDADVPWEHRAHFYAVAARTMRRILVDHARAKRRLKRGGDHVDVTLEESAIIDPERPPDLEALDEALERLAGHDERKARAVELHYFGGLNYDETARVLGISTATVHRDLRMAKAWLYQQLR